MSAIDTIPQGRKRSKSSHELGKAALVGQLHDFGVSIKQESLRRDNPEWSKAQVNRALRRWLGHEGYTSIPEGPFEIRLPRPL